MPADPGDGPGMGPRHGPEPVTSAPDPAVGAGPARLHALQRTGASVLWLHGHLLRAEETVCRRVNAWSHTGWVRVLFGTVSRLGDGVLWYAVMAVLAVTGGPGGPTAAARMALTGLAATTVYKVLKGVFRRQRPPARHEGLHLSVPPLDEFSFPSGHTLHAVAFTIVAVEACPPLAVLLVPFAALVAVSRVVLGLHYVSDVLVGALLGVQLGLWGLQLPL